MEQWDGLKKAEFDTRSSARALSIFKDLAYDSSTGTVLLSLIFFELFMEFGEVPNSDKFSDRFIAKAKKIEDELKEDLEEKDVMRWFLKYIRR